MRRFLRWAINSAAAVSALLFVAVSVPCVLIPRRCYGVYWSRPSGLLYTLETYAGAVHFEREAMPLDFYKPGLTARQQGTADSLTMYSLHDAGNPGGTPKGILGIRRYSYLQHFVYYPIDGKPAASAQGQYNAAVVPAALLVPMLALLPAVRLWPWLRRRRRIRAGLCLTCGYDLRATPERCPECGAVSKKIES